MKCDIKYFFDAIFVSIKLRKENETDHAGARVMRRDLRRKEKTR